MTTSTRPTPTTLFRPTRFGRSALLALALSGVLGAVGPGSGAGAGFGAEAGCFTVGLPSASAAEAKQSAWVPGTVVPDAELKQFPIGDWFRAAPIPDDVFARMRGKSFKADCTVPRGELRYVTVLHYGADGKIRRGEMVVNRAAAADVTDVFQKLFEAQYPIERMTLIDDFGADDEASMRANNSSAFNFRVVKGSKKLSAHARGLAVDINPLYNPYVRVMKDGTTVVQPEAGRPYADREGFYPFRIDADDLAVKLFKAKGWSWGGDWKSLKDFQHFEKPLP